MLWRPSRNTARAALLLAGLVLAPESGSAERPLIAHLKWLHPDADVVAALTTRLAECLVMPSDPAQAQLARLGRVAFRSPVLLGGVASRVGMSCDSCHPNGHDNPVFHFAGVSGGPGTADVTGAVFSKNREDGLRNPVPIPTLVDAGSAPPFGSVLPAPDLRTFLHAAVVDEFQGEPPLEPVLEALMVYLAGLRSAGCPKPREEALSFGVEAAALLETFDVVIESVDGGDRGVGKFALLSLRAALERVYRRFPADFAAREELVERSRALSEIGTRLDSPSEQGPLGEVVPLLAEERLRLEATLRMLGSQAELSFYEATVLRKALELAP